MFNLTLQDDGFNNARLSTYDRMLSLDPHRGSLSDLIAYVQRLARLPENTQQVNRLEAHVEMLSEWRDRFGAQTWVDAYNLLKERSIDSLTVKKWIENGAISYELDGHLVIVLMRSYPEHEALLMDNI